MDENKNKRKIVQAIKKKNILMFSKKNNELTKKIKLKIEELKRPMESLMEKQSRSQIIKYKQLFNDGIITEGEFNIKKEEFLKL